MKTLTSKCRSSVIMLICSLIFTGTALRLDRGTKDETYKELSLFADTLSIIQSQYVEQTQPKELIYGSLKGMLSSLDPYSEFLSPKEYADLKSDTEGRFGGVGMEITIKDGLVTVVSPLEDTPAWSAGIKAGDKIVKIDDTITRDYSLTDAVNLLRGNPDTKVKITVWRPKEKKMFEFEVTRALIKIEEIKNVRIINSGIGYIRIVEFSEGTAGDLYQALQNLEEKGMQALVLDIRYNPGGLLESAVDVAEFFLEKDKTIVSTKGRTESQNIVFRSKRSSKYNGLPLAVLINEGSASGSEIVAGALQDHKKAIIIGEKSFGKGVVQTVIPLPDGSAVKLTTSQYFTPSGKNINGEGIIPDIEVIYREISPFEEKNEEEKIKEEISKQLKTEEKPPDSFMEQLKRDNQLMSAVDVLKGLLLFNQSKNKS